MATFEQMLLSKIILSLDGMKNAMEWGVCREDFRTETNKSVWDQLYSDYTSPQHPGSCIGANAALLKYPALNLQDIDPNMSLDHLCTEVRKYRVGQYIQERSVEIQKIAEFDPTKAASLVQEVSAELRQLELGKKSDVDFGTGVQKVVDRYQKVKSGSLVGRFPWPWHPLQLATGGIQDDDYILLYGRPKSKKTWVLTYLIFWAYLHGVRILFYTKEMTDENLYMRISAFIMSVIYDELRLGNLTPEKEQELQVLLQEAKNVASSMICLSAKDADGRDTVAWLHGKIEKYKPDVVFIDGMYLMSTESRRPLKDNERVQAISRAIRSMILTLRVPVIATVQANRKAAGHQEANLDEVAFSDSLSQDCTMAIRVIKDKEQPTMSLVLGSNTREFDLPGFKIYAVPCTNFTYHSPLTAADAEKVQAQDVEEVKEDTTNNKPVEGKKRGRPRGSKTTQAQRDNFASDVQKHMQDMQLFS
jgi:replicative DNA helicase